MPRRNSKTEISPASGWAVYLRTSDQDAQDPENSQRRQREAIKRNLISLSDMPIFNEYIDNLSGRYAHNRRQYQAMLEDARSGKFSHVVVENAERFGRNDTEALRAIDELNDLGIAIRFADYPDLDPVDPDDRILVSLSFTLARRESIKLGQRVKGGLHAKLRSGGFTGLAPDGYKNMERRTDAHDKLLHGKYTRWIEVDEERAPIWRLAWQLLLEDRYTLEEICEHLHEKGYQYRQGRPFVEIKPNSGRKHNFNTLSRIFHNWFYAGWVVSEKAGIAPKTIRGNWMPLVTTEDFERGLEILSRRNQNRFNKRKHEYLLRGLVYVNLIYEQYPVRLTGSTTNAGRAGGGTTYYCDSRRSVYIPCDVIDKQIPSLFRNIQVDPELLPLIRTAYTDEVAAKLGLNRVDEREELQAALQAITEEESRSARLFAAGKITDEVWDALWADWRDRRSKLRQTLDGLERRQEYHVNNLESALAILSNIALLYNGLERSDQHELLRQMVEKVIVNFDGEIICLDLLPPFAYLEDLTRRVKSSKSQDEKSKTTNQQVIGRQRIRSNWIPSGDSGGI